MFGENTSSLATTNSNNSDILKSGYDPLQVKGTNKLRSQFVKALTFNPEDSKENTAKEAAKISGKYRGMAVMAKRVSEQKLEAGQAILDTYGIALDHTSKAVDLELGWQKKTQQALESISPKLLDMAVHQEQHRGFAEYCDMADKHLKF